MNKVLHGAIIGLIIGGSSVLLTWVMYMSVLKNINNANPQHWTMIFWIVGYTTAGAILGAVLPKHK